MADIGGYQAVGSFLDKYISYSQARSMQSDMNEYNDPRNQVSRMAKAGLSPWNYSGEGNTSAQPVVSDSKLGESLGAIADRKLANRQLDIQENLSNAQAEQTRSLTETNRKLLKYLDESEQTRIENQKADTRVKNVTEASEAKKVSRYDEQVNQDLELKKATEAYYYAQTDNCKASTNRINRMLSWEIKESKSRINVNNSQVAVLKSQCKLNDYQIKQIVSLMQKNKVEIEKLGFENWLLKHDNELIKYSGVKRGTPIWSALVDVLNQLAFDNYDLSEK